MTKYYEVTLEKSLVTTFHIDFDLEDKSKILDYYIEDNELRVELIDGREFTFPESKAVQKEVEGAEDTTCYEISEDYVDKDCLVKIEKKYKNFTPKEMIRQLDHEPFEKVLEAQGYSKKQMLDDCGEDVFHNALLNHNVKIKNIGFIHNISQDKIQYYFM